MAGVHAVLTADDLPPRMATGQIPMLVPNPSIRTPRTQLALARHEVCYVGQTIAVVIADNRYLAEDAAAAVAVDFEVLPAVSDCRDAAKPGAACAHSDLASNIAAVVPMSLWRRRRGICARGARVRGGVVASSRRRHDARRARRARELRSGQRRADGVVGDADAAPVPRHARRSARARSRIDPRDRAPSSAAASAPRRRSTPRRRSFAAAAMKLRPSGDVAGGPARAFLSATQERDQHWKVAIAVDADGKILGLRGTMLHDNGAFLPWGIIAPYIAATTFPALMWCRPMRSRSRSCSPTACRPRSCAAPAGRRPCSRWSG